MAADLVPILVSGLLGAGALWIGWYQLRMARIERTSQFRLTLYERQLDAYSEIAKSANEFTDLYNSSIGDSSYGARNNIQSDTLKVLSDGHWKVLQVAVSFTPILPTSVRLAADEYLDFSRLLFGDRQIPDSMASTETYLEIFKKNSGAMALGVAHGRLNAAMISAAGTVELTEELSNMIERKKDQDSE